MPLIPAERLSRRDVGLFLVGALLLGFTQFALERFAYPPLGITDPPKWGISGLVPYYAAWLAVCMIFGALGFFRRSRTTALVLTLPFAISLTLLLFWLYR